MNKKINTTTNVKEEKLSVVSLFSGCGGLDLGFKWENFDIIWANDNMRDACETYKKNIGNHIVCKSILDIDPEKIPHADLIIGGPPCQGFSGIGKRDPNDKRSSLVWSYLNIINHVKPKVFLFENVTGLKSSRSSDGLKVIDKLAEAFEGIGYKINIYTLNAADYGVPQKRKRVFIIGNQYNIDIEPPPQTHSEDGKIGKKWVSSFEAISDLGKPNDKGKISYEKKCDCDYQKFMRINTAETDLHITPYASKKDIEIIKHIKPGGNYMDVPDEISTKRIMYFKKTGGRTTTYGRLDQKEPNYTLNTYFNRPNIGCNIHYSEDRMITIREGLRFQSFPDNFNLVGSTKRNFYIQVGNAVPPLLSLAWAKHLKQTLLNNSKNKSENKQILLEVFQTCLTN